MSCKNDKKTESFTKTNSKEAVKETKSDSGIIGLTGDDAMKFNKSELKVKAGQEVTLTLTHTGKLGENVMGHNFVLLKQGTDISEFAAKAVSAGPDNEYIPDGDFVLASTRLIGGGEQVTITFDAPEKGVYDFICSFPGHFGMMKGKFIVE